ncbi:hypothetical protein Q5705_03675 [Kosakonia sp. H02]|nr:hypothetical protein Q5705_03675 [Kosakonia sp. H02]
MKIAYLIRHDITKNDGVTKKILGQVREWERMGADIKIFAYVPKKGNSMLPAHQHIMQGAIISRILPDMELLSELNIFSPDIVYFRYDTWSTTISRIMSRYTSIAELNTLDLSEFHSLIKFEKNIKSIIRYVAYKFFRGLVLKKVSGIVSVTYEIKNDLSNSKYGKPSVVVPNGIALDTYKTIKQSVYSNLRTGLFFIGTPGQPWHGVDIIEQLARQLPEMDFHVVGIEGDNLPNLYYHGYLNTQEYIAILAKCAVCIGTLGLHRKNMVEACPLKVREYLAYGYPVILGYQDTAFIEQQLQPDFVHFIDTSKDITPEAAAALKRFIEDNKNKVVPTSKIEFLDTKFLEKKRYEFFSHVLANKK